MRIGYGQNTGARPVNNSLRFYKELSIQTDRPTDKHTDSIFPEEFLDSSPLVSGWLH